MPLLFSYGTLQQGAVQLALFGRPLQGQADELIGFEQQLLTLDEPESATTGGKATYSIVKFTGRNDSRVTGTVFELSESEVIRADRYEPAPYQRVSAILASGKEVWVYAHADFR